MKRSSMKYFASLGGEVERRWARCGFDEHELGRIAQDVLHEMPACAHTSLDDLVHWTLTAPSRELLPQADIQSRFGEPPITVYTGQSFHIVVNFWRSATTNIHQHAFGGAFQVLAGSSVHSSYEFEETRRVNSHFRIGKVIHRGTETLRPGDVRTIFPGHGRAHSLFHLEHPSATVVVRTHGELEFLPQLTYWPPGVAFDASFMEQRQDPILVRRAQMLLYLQDTDRKEFNRWLETVLGPADPWTTFALLVACMNALVKQYDGSITSVAERIGQLLQPLRAQDPELAACIFRSFVEALCDHDIARRRHSITNPDHRFFCCVLREAPNREALLALIEQRFPDEAPLHLLLRWIDQMAQRRSGGGEEEDGLNVLGMEEDAVSILKHMIRLEPASTFEELMAALRQSYSIEDLRAQEADLRALYREFRELSMWKSLFVPGAR